MWLVSARWPSFAMACALAACGDPAAHVTLAPVLLPSSCGHPKNATGIRVTAYTGTGELTRAVGLDEIVDLSDFPASTEQLGVEVALGGGAIGAIGKTTPLAFDALEEGTSIAIVMIPPGGICQTAGFLTEPRQAPLVARAGDGVLVVGGQGATGKWLGTAEYYDPATAMFTPVDVSSVLGAGGFGGASLATLPDGRVALSGGPVGAITLFDPVTRTFGDSVLIGARGYHTSIALGGNQLLLAGGCLSVANGVCTGLPLNSTIAYDTTNIHDSAEIGPTLRVAHLGATPFSLGILDDGKAWYALAGGSPPASADPMTPMGDPSGADLIAPIDSSVARVTGLKAQVTALDGGALISAFAPDADLPKQQASMLAPGATAARTTALAPPLSGVRLVLLEDGRVAGFGGDPAGALQLYDPTIDRWSSILPGGPGGVPVPAFSAPTLMPLLDGTILVIDGGAATQNAYLYRPSSLLGPAAGSTTVIPGGTTTVLTAPDPDTVVRTPEWQLVGSGNDLARALVGGPRFATGSVRATVRVKAGGVAVLAEQTGPGRVLVGELVPGGKARIVRHDAGTTRVLCTGKTVPDVDPMVAVTARLEIAGTTASLFLGDTELAGCDVGTVERGAWGVAAIGDGARVSVDTVPAAR